MDMRLDYPGDDAYRTPHPLFTGIHEVRATNSDNYYVVDMDMGTCDCAHGKAWRWASSKWVPANWCSHKLRAAASILTETPDPEAQIAYNKLLGKRYIIWESVSAFHKELRRGDTEAACYWALSVAAHRGLTGVVGYMLNIVFEETRDLKLAHHLLRLAERGRSLTFNEAMSAVRYFAKSPKKWELEPRLGIFLDEMLGYRALARDYTYDVAKGKEIIPFSEHDKLRDALITGFKTGARNLVQYGHKGLFKSKYPTTGNDGIKIELFNLLTEALNEEGPFKGSKLLKKWDVDKVYAHAMHAHLMRRQSLGSFGYHELNALCDALTGERYHSGESGTNPAFVRAYLSPSATYSTPLGVFRQIPLYALDNHNFRGKHLMSRWGSIELLPGAKQDNLDFRWCGAYMGVAWRYLAYDQHKTCDIPWGDVKWTPTWLWKHLDRMWY